MMHREYVREIIKTQLLKRGFVVSDNVNAHIVELLDSINLVDFIMDIQDALEEAAGKPVHILSDKAFSRRSSPFRTEETLTEYIMELI